MSYAMKLSFTAPCSLNWVPVSAAIVGAGCPQMTQIVTQTIKYLAHV